MCKFVSDFREKAELFNTFFTEKCSPPENNSKLQKNNVRKSNDNIMKIINNLNSNKAQGFYMISIEILKLYGFSLCKHLSVIFNSRLRNFL